MSEIRKGLRHALSLPVAWNLWQKVVDSDRWHRRTMERHVIPNLFPGAKIIDIGCGTGDITEFLPGGVQYSGFDRNPLYIQQATARFAKPNVSFSCMELSAQNPEHSARADIVLALSLLHHLTDDECIALFGLASSILRPGGLLITKDPVYTSTQSRLARWIISKDRGTEVRTLDAYIKLASTSMSQVKVDVDDNPLRIPFTALVMECTR